MTTGMLAAPKSIANAAVYTETPAPAGRKAHKKPSLFAVKTAAIADAARGILVAAELRRMPAALKSKSLFAVKTAAIADAATGFPAHAVKKKARKLKVCAEKTIALADAEMEILAIVIKHLLAEKTIAIAAVTMVTLVDVNLFSRL